MFDEKLTPQSLHISQWVDKHGVNALNESIQQNYNMLERIARQYAKFYTKCQYADIVLHGISGLLTALPKFKPDKNVKLPTYAHYWIVGAMKKYISEIYKQSENTVSLSQQTYADNLSTNDEHIGLIYNDAVSEEIDQEKKVYLNVYLNVLSPIEKKVIDARYLEVPKQTFLELSKKLGNVSKQYVHKVEKTALKKLSECLKTLVVTSTSEFKLTRKEITKIMKHLISQKNQNTLNK